MNASLQTRRRELGDDLFFDFPWVFLLQLYLAEVEGRCVNLIDLAVQSGSRPESVRRWLRVLEERRLVDSVAQPSCAAQLTAMGIAKVERLLGSAV